jgi:hypothetical protein
MRLTGRAILGEPEDPEQARRVLRRAVELGVNLKHPAWRYCDSFAGVSNFVANSSKR